MHSSSNPRFSAVAAVAALILSTPALAQLQLLDTTAPDVTVNAPASGAFVAGNVAIDVTATDPLIGTGVAQVAYQVNSTSGGWSPLSFNPLLGKWTGSWNVAALADGGHFLYVRATDYAGNANTVRVSLVVAQAPAMPMGLRVVAPTSPSNGGHLDLSWTANTEADLTGYFIYRSNAYAGPYARIGTVTANAYHDTNIKNGSTYYYLVSAFDAAGNESERSAPGQGAAYDTLAPAITAVAAVAARSDRADITWKTDEGATSQVLYGETASLGSSTPIVSQGRTDHAVTVAGLEQGTTYFYRVRSMDASGNATVSDVRSFATPQDLPPSVTIVSPADGAVITGPAKLEVIAADDVAVAAVEYTFDGINWTAMPFNTLTGRYQVDLSALPDGQHTIGARASDEVGQTAQQAINVTVDRAAPVVEWVSPVLDAHLPGGAVHTFQVSAQDTAIATVEYQVYVVPTGVEMEEAPPADAAAWQPMTLNTQTGYYEVAYTAPVVLVEAVAYVYARAVDSAGKATQQIREVTFLPTGRDFAAIGSAGQELTGTVATGVVTPGGPNMIGIQVIGGALTPGGVYTVTVSGSGGTHHASFTADARGRGEAAVEEPSGITDPFAATITLSGPGF